MSYEIFTEIFKSANRELNNLAEGTINSKPVPNSVKHITE
jgi:hypothetical protein